MKPQTTEITSLKKTQEKNSKPEVLNISYFYNLFAKEKKRYAPSLFHLDKKIKAKRPEIVSLRIYKKIILEFLKIYFYEFYWKNGPSYFFLGGLVKKVLTKKWSRKQKLRNSEKTIVRRTDGAIQFFWYMRPSIKFFHMVKLTKLTGKTNQLPVIEQQYLKIHDKNLLPIFGEERKNAKTNKYLYRCSQI